jgi:hypothetical protein
MDFTQPNVPHFHGVFNVDNLVMKVKIYKTIIVPVVLYV